MTPNADTRSDRILAGKLHLLYRGTTVILANLGVATVLAWLVHESYPVRFLAGWLTATAVVCAARIALQRWFIRSSDVNRCNICWARRFTFGAFAQGLLWGAVFSALPLWGAHHDFVLMTVVGTGMAAGALATISAHLPAYMAYTGAFVIPLGAVSLANSDRYTQGIGVLLILYFVVIVVTAWRSNAFINRTVALKVDNEILQDSLKAAQRERDAARAEKWTTLAQLSHELRTPLNAILGFTEAMEREFFGPLGNPRYKDYAGYVLSSGRHLLLLADELLQISQGESGRLKLEESAIDLTALANSVAAVMSPGAQKASVALVCDAPAALPCLKGDATKVRQMLINLVDNALKFTAPGGRAVIRLGVTPHGQIVLTIEDNGIGMRPDDIPEALKPFGRLSTPLTSQTSGAGLGLPICNRLAELHGAELTIDSQEGWGTICRIVFPPERTLAARAAAA